MSKQMRVKGFTLVELLAVILILAVIALITTPIIFNALRNANENAFLDTAYSINKAADNYYATLITDNNTVPVLITYKNGKISSSQRINSSGVLETSTTNYLNYTGSHPDSGNVYISSSGEVEMAIYDENTDLCVTKSADDKSPVKSTKTENQCKLNKTIP